MNLKDRLCDVEADCRDCQHDELLRILVASSTTDSKALARPVGGAVHSITSGNQKVGCLAEVGSDPPKADNVAIPETSVRQLMSAPSELSTIVLSGSVYCAKRNVRSQCL
jgi:hypothetical protein